MTKKYKRNLVCVCLGVLAVITSCLSLIFGSIKFAEGKNNTYYWCREDVLYWHQYAYPDEYVLALEGKELDVVGDTDDGLYFKAYRFTIYYAEFPIKSRTYLASIYYKPSNGMFTDSNNIRKHQIIDLDVAEIDGDYYY